MVDDMYSFRSGIAHGQLVPKKLVATRAFTNDNAKVTESYPTIEPANMGWAFGKNSHDT